jgi:hypothetical protein
VIVAPVSGRRREPELERCRSERHRLGQCRHERQQGRRFPVGEVHRNARR